MADAEEPDEAEVLDEAIEAHSLGDHDRAIQLCTWLIERDADWAQPFYFRGASRLTQDDPAGALEDLERAIDLDPDIPAFAYHDRGRALAALGRHQEALADYEHALRLQPDKASTCNRMGTTLYHLGRLSDALAAYTEAVRLAPDRSDYHFDRGALHLAQGKFDEAIADFSRAIELEPEAHYFFSRGTAYLRRDDHDRALADLDKAIQIDPQHARAWYARGYVCFLTRRREQGEEAFARAVELDESLMDWPYEERWLSEQCVRAEAYLRERGLSQAGLPEEPDWELAPYLGLWRVGDGATDLWVIVGDCPTDSLMVAEAGDARAALAAFGRRWQRAAANVLAGREDPGMEVGPREQWSELGPMLQTRAELLLEYAANDDFWENEPHNSAG